MPIHTIDLHNTSGAYYAPATISPGPGSKTIQISGQPGTGANGELPSDYESQIHLALLNLHRVIIAAGATVNDISKLNVYIVNYDPARRLHTRHIQKFLGKHRPAMTLVPVPRLAGPGWLIEIDAVVERQSSQSTSIPTALTIPTTAQYDVVVLGAGLAGLTAAEQVIRSGYSCLVLEARDRVGGRTFSSQLPASTNAGSSQEPGVTDLGAAWINDTNQWRMYRLARRANADLIEQNITGNYAVIDAEGSRHVAKYGNLPFANDAESQKQLAEIRDTVEADCQQLEIEGGRPKKTENPRLSSLDSMTFLAYLQTRCNASARAISNATVWTRAMLGQEPRDISALYFLLYCRGGGGLLQMRSDGKNGAQYLRVRQGTQVFAKTLANSLPVGSVQLSSPVYSIHQQHKDHTIIQSASQTVTARKVISAVPAAVLKDITFDPPLPARKELLLNSFRYGYYTKVMMIFKQPFWIAKGFSGLAQSFNGPISVVRDTSVPADNKWILTCFMSGDPGRAWYQLPSAQIKKDVIIDQLGDLYADRVGVREAFIDSLSHEWVEEKFSGYGCPCPALAPGVLDAVGDSLQEPFRNVHFVGTETADEWKGYMEGAVQSGERGAGEVVSRLAASVARL